MKTLTVRNITLGSGLPKVAVPLVDADAAALIAQAEKVAALAPDVIEWRIDFYQDVLDEEKLAQTAAVIRQAIGETVLLITFRTKGEGGELALADDQYFALLKFLAEHQLGDLIDVELEHDQAAVKEVLEAAHHHGVKVVMSNHDFEQTPSQAEQVARMTAMADLGADVAKVASMPQSPADVLTVLAATVEARAKLDLPIITMSMGDLGKVSRVSGQAFGSALTFAAVGKTSAPGQIGLADLRHDLADLTIN
ncbi:type I 3-dehydroquinate dehydratase [Limosilactobacillus fermentum]|uniref:type I 3-dehydroquinate dehydratase n=1 Tax=Limosilactobacillus fermentum TaxID=1613 RepID=UPI0005835282|nr:type I 3-dehydroquinate dehydratase [Limosilactobacillus fermentum]CDI68636.1 3-dehydroquinate dehydratase (3-dehydroquinase) (Type I DHQase) [Limosilactobacillus fermentum L930BB]